MKPKNCLVPQGLEIQIIKFEDKILLKSKAPFEKTSLSDVAGCLQYNGPRKSDEDIQNAIKQGVNSERLIHDPLPNDLSD